MFISATTKIIVLVVTGIALCIGFWIGKKITSKCDEWLFVNSKEGKELLGGAKEGSIP